MRSARRAPDVEVRVVRRFRLGRAAAQCLAPLPAERRLDRPVDASAGRARACDVAVVGGGVSLYEACALGVAAVGVPVVVRAAADGAGFVRRGAALGALARASVPRGGGRRVCSCCGGAACDGSWRGRAGGSSTAAGPGARARAIGRLLAQA